MPDGTGTRPPTRTHAAPSRVDQPTTYVDEAGRYPGTLAAAIKRVSWGAILAGVAIVLVIQLMLNLLGLSIGLGAIGPVGEQGSFDGLATGTGIWLVIVGIIALFLGGWAAARLAGLPQRLDGILHGVVTWAVATFIVFYLVSSGVGTVMSGAFSVVQSGAQLIGQGVQAVAPAAGDAISGAAGQVSVDEVRREALAILRQTGKEELQPENLSRRIEQAGATAGQTAQDAAQSPAQAEQEIQQAFDRLLASGEAVVNEIDRQAAVNVLVARTDMSEAEARQTVDEYVQVANQARERIRSTAQDVRQGAAQATDDVLDAVSRAAIFGFFAMLFGAAAAAGGGAAGVPRDMPASPAIRRE